MNESDQPQQPGQFPPSPEQPPQPQQPPPQQPAQGYPPQQGYPPPQQGYQQPPQGYPPQGYAPQPYAPQPWALQPMLPAALVGKQFADYGQRVGAFFIDLVLGITIIGGIINWFLMGRQGERNGQTLGKQVVNIRVFREDGQPVTVGFAIVREFLVRGLLIGLVGGFFLGLPFLLDLLWPLWDERNQTLHDKIVSSYVIKADTPPMAAPA